MMTDNDETKFEQWLQDAAKGYHAPRPTPRDEMWARIEAARVRRVPHGLPRRPPGRPGRYPFHGSSP